MRAANREQLLAQGGHRVALCGSGGSHPALIRTIADALTEIDQVPLIIDLSAFDRRGTADYSRFPLTEHVTPGDAGMRDRFNTAAPNIVISGGMLAFRRLEKLFAAMLESHGIGALMLCHGWGYPEQALMRAARRLKIHVFLIDEGPFSLPLHGDGGTETSRLRNRLAFAALRAIGLLPRRDMTGALVDTVLCTAPGRSRKLAELGVPGSKLVTVPPPRFDALAQTARAWRPGCGRDGSGRSQLLWLHQPFGLDGKVSADEVARAELALVDALCAVNREHPLRIAARIHPRAGDAERARLEALFTDHGLQAAESRPDLYEDFLHSDTVVGFYSSALLEAMICAIPVVASRLDEAGFSERSEASKIGDLVALGVPAGRTAAEIAESLRKGLQAGRCPPSEQLMEREIGMLDGNGARTVADLLVAALKPG